MDLKSGVLMHISSLYGDHSCGSFSKSAKEFISFLKASGFTCWQVLPLCLPDQFNSPYLSVSSYFGNPNFIDLEDLYSLRLITKEELNDSLQTNEYLCEFDRLNEQRMPLLKKAARRCNFKDKVLDFINQNEEVKEACLFLALKEINGGKPWQEFKILEVEDNILFEYYFIQYMFYTQWQELHDFANKNGIKIIGDLPFYVALDSSDVYFNKESFLLDKNGNPKLVAGVPPDYFSKTGQLWGNPVYDFSGAKQNGYSFFKKRFKFMLNLFDGIRLDHFRAFSEFYGVEYNAENAINGKWYKAPGKEIIDIIKDLKEDKLIIAENLGTIDNKVNQLLEYSKFMSMSVFQFGFDGNYKNPHLPHNYNNNTVAFTGTHDNNTLLGFIWEQDESTRKNILEYIGYLDNNFDNCYGSIISCLLRSSAGLVLLPIQDILCFGEDTRLNTPGKAENNWAFRITKQALNNVDKDKYLKLNKIYGRI